MLRRKQRRRPRAQPLIHLLPNMFTVLSLCAGLTAIRYALDGRFELAVALIIVAEYWMASMAARRGCSRSARSSAPSWIRSPTS